MKRLLTPATALTTLRRIAFTLLCCTVLMVPAAPAQTIQQMKADPYPINQGPPAGPLLDLSGTPIPGGGNTTYLPYTVTFTAPAGQSSTAITFAFRDDPAQISLAYASVVDQTAGSNNLLTNGDFSQGTYTYNGNSGTPNGWTYANVYGAEAGGYVTNYSGYCYTLNGVAVSNCWFDGAVQGYDAISQTITTVPGHTYQISFYVAEDSAIFAYGGNECCGFPPSFPGSNCWAAAQTGYSGPACTFSDLSTNGDVSDPGGNGINVTAYALPGLPPPPNQETLTVTGAGAGTGTVLDTSYSQIDCTITAGSASGTCMASYSMNAMVTLTATPADDGMSTFGGWGGACASSTTSTCTVTMSSAQSVTAIFNQTGSSTQAGEASPGTPLDLNFSGGFSNNGYDASTLLASGSPSFTVQVNAIVQPVDPPVLSCNQLVQATPAFSNAQCFVYSNPSNPNNPVPYGTVMFEYTCPGSDTNGQCGAVGNPDFIATLGTDFYFDSTNDPLFYANQTLPLVGWLKGSGPFPLHPCTPGYDESGHLLPLFQSNQISSFTDPTSTPTQGNGKGNSQGTGSCWALTYLTTPTEAPSVTIASPVNGGTYQQNQVTSANYTCTAVNAGANSPTGPYLTVPPGNCTATDSPGGSVANGAQFDTTTLGPHTFTATVMDSALNTVSQTYTYNVVGATDVAILKVAPSKVATGSKLTYGIGVGDLGPANGVNVVVNDPLPTGTSFVSASGSNVACSIVKKKLTCSTLPVPCNFAGGTVSCNVGTIMPLSLSSLNGAAIEITVKVTAAAGARLTNTATVSESNADTNPSNSSSTANTTVTAH